MKSGNKLQGSLHIVQPPCKHTNQKFYTSFFSRRILRYPWFNIESMLYSEGLILLSSFLKPDVSHQLSEIWVFKAKDRDRGLVRLIPDHLNCLSCIKRARVFTEIFIKLQFLYCKCFPKEFFGNLNKEKLWQIKLWEHSLEWAYTQRLRLEQLMTM